ncbi:hydroxymethylbilane synthase [Paralimibaculum aggregatum]|uniref:Porphobilinogen deaminase n=1 Tax=Paralimibaculum aggregatum TaxID=3036245 RepID=A0ABQ6LIA4_9RHOB|nr:hydroxymethylbilane synthase [Limibaculum sp. NKW23]GMG82707.1 hydroxymethylbilane synthase [Limibaculum sp. NKW23]
MTLPSPDQPLRIGTRGSPLALAQAEETRARLMAAHGLPEAAFRIAVIRTTGDAVQNRALSEIGGKGLFTKEIEEALFAGSIDIAVHSMKDMPTVLPEGLEIGCLLPREDVRDVFVTGAGGPAGIAALAPGAVVGTSSLRRRAQLLHRRPDLRVVEFRGNVQTRLKKLADGVAEATFLALAGLRRLGHGETELGAPVPVDEMLPAVAQGAIGIELRRRDADLAALLAPVHDAPTASRLAAERAFLAGLDGSCRTPIAGLAEIDGAAGGTLRLRGEIVRPDGSERLATERRGPLAEAAAMGADAAAELRARGGDGFFDS